MLALLVTNVQMLLRKIRQTSNNSVADAGIPVAGPGGNPFSHIFWLAKEGKREHTADTSTSPAPSPSSLTFPIFKML
eukprot:1148838-Pelagomonas_calceolata.AAC.2